MHIKALNYLMLSDLVTVITPCLKSVLLMWFILELMKCLFCNLLIVISLFLSSYVDPEAVIGCEDGKVRVFDLYSRKCSQIIKYDSVSLLCACFVH